MKKNKIKLLLLITSVCLLICIVIAKTVIKEDNKTTSSFTLNDMQAPAFPGAEGYGAISKGGRGGRVIYVNTLSDYDPQTESPIEGSLRWAVNQPGPRNILFKVSGDIALKTPLHITEPYITIAGQSSPGGICIRDAQFGTETHDVIIRYMRFRNGDKRQKEEDSFNIIDSYNIILDHCSFSWSIDEVLSAQDKTSFHNSTFQWCIISEALQKSYHPKGNHSMGSLISGDGGLSLHHCLFANNANRNPRSGCLVLDFRNNVVYNWQVNICYTREAPSFINMINNYFKPGPDTPTSKETIAFAPGDAMANIYLSGNRVFNHSEINDNNQNQLVSSFKGATSEQMASIIVNKPFETPFIKTTSALEAYEKVLKEAGAILPYRDAVDTRVINGIQTGTGKIINSPQEVGGYPNLSPQKSILTDSDNDGMPDDWEKESKLNPKDSIDGSQDLDNDGYTNLEEFLNGTNPNKKDTYENYNYTQIVTMGKQAMQMITDKLQTYKDEQQRLQKAKEARKLELIRTTKAVFSESPALKRPKITLTLNNKAIVTLVRIPAGSFMMGATEEEHGEPIEYPQHKVNISKDFYIATTKVTTAQYCAVIPEARTLTKENEKLPSQQTTWYEAVDFCDILSAATGFKFRLPTEAEWEYSCRAGTTTFFNVGNTITSEQANFNALEATQFNPKGIVRGKYTEVDQFAPNAWGLYDMHGNEAEFCLDNAFRKYTKEEVTDPLFQDPNAKRYVIRGGKAQSKAFYIRSAYRYSYTPDVGYSFRFVVEIPRDK